MDSAISSFLSSSRIDWKPTKEEIKAINLMISGKKTRAALNLCGLEYKSRSKRYRAVKSVAGFYRYLIFLFLFFFTNLNLCTHTTDAIKMKMAKEAVVELQVVKGELQKSKEVEQNVRNDMINLQRVTKKTQKDLQVVRRQSERAVTSATKKMKDVERRAEKDIAYAQKQADRAKEKALSRGQQYRRAASKNVDVAGQLHKA